MVLFFFFFLIHARTETYLKTVDKIYISFFKLGVNINDRMIRVQAFKLIQFRGQRAKRERTFVIAHRKSKLVLAYISNYCILEI